jgi:hypothetical protein
VIRRGMAVALPMMVFVVAACGGSKGATNAGADADVVKSPIAEYLGYDPEALKDPAQAQAKFAEEERVRQDAVAACMKKQGFDYIPVDPSTYTAFADSSGDGLEYGSDEWTAKYGFGISTQRWPQTSVGPDLIGYDDSQFNADNAPKDPNQDYVTSLGEAEQQAYQKALYGEAIAATATSQLTTDDTATAEPSFQMGGCMGEAESGTNALQTKFYQEFSDELDALYQRAQEDPRVVAFDKKVSDCVSGKGLEYTGQEQVMTDIEQQLEEISKSVTEPGAGLTDQQLSAMSEEELTKIFNQPTVLSPEAKAKLAEVQANEIAVAKAVGECGGNYQEQGKVIQEVMAEFEQQFLDDNSAKLAELKSGA